MANRSDMAAVALAGAASVDTPDVALNPRRRLLRRLAKMSSRIAGVVTVVPFVPVQARVAAGAVTGVATAIDVAMRPRKDRPSALAYIPQDEKQITADPVLFATDAASVLATTAIAATRTMASGTRRILTQRTATVIAVVGVTVAGTFVVYRFVVQPVMRRRALRDWAETQEAWGPAEAAVGALPGAEIQWTGFDAAVITGTTATPGTPGGEGAVLVETVGLAMAADGTEVLVVEVDEVAVDASPSTDARPTDGAEPTGDAAGEPDLGPGAWAAADPADDVTPAAAEGEEPPKKKRRLGRG
jgi:hypothetical protein